MIEGRYLYGADQDLQEVFEIRKKVYVEEEHLPESYEFDGLDRLCQHGVITVKGKNVGTGRILFDGDEYRIGHIAVLKEERGKKYGDFLVRMLIDRAFLSGADEVLVGAKTDAVAFYSRIGFSPVTEEYQDNAGINRIDMKVTKSTLCKECAKN